MIEPRLFMEFLDFEHDGLQDYSFQFLQSNQRMIVHIRSPGSEYIRIGESIKTLREYPEHERALWFATGRYKFENAVALPHQSSDEVVEKLDIKTYYDLAKIEVPKSRAEIMRQLCSLDFIKEDLEVDMI